MQNGSSVGISTHCVHVFARFVPICMLSRCLLTKFPRRSSGGSFLRVRCWLGNAFFSPSERMWSGERHSSAKKKTEVLNFDSVERQVLQFLQRWKKKRCIKIDPPLSLFFSNAKWRLFLLSLSFSPFPFPSPAYPSSLFGIPSVRFPSFF